MSFSLKENPLIGTLTNFRRERRVNWLKRNGVKTYIAALQQVRLLQSEGSGSGQGIEEQVIAFKRECEISDNMHRARQLATEMVQHRLLHPAKIFKHQRINRRFFPETDPSNYHGEIFPDGKVK
ncbi:hypothetical protein HY345_01580 [Candidatus Microgenomates bacterium]|nr:hypothetical protein [Candidatus Microgenomates bacterium]